MGVINVTPDSFSDGSKYNQFESFEKQMLSMVKSFDIIDVGAESTAPKNDPISAELEIERLDNTLIAYLKKHKSLNLPLSIDTYKTEVFEWALKEVRTILGQEHPVIFNDVSGKVDDELLALMNKYKFTYVLSHNLCPDRSLTSMHMDYNYDLCGADFLREIKKYFKDALSKLSECKSQIILDPCFGFSKTKEQNHYLISNIAHVFDEFSYELLIGVSRKSFLLNELVDRKSFEGQKSLDVTQAVLLNHFIDKTKQPLIFRVHDLCSIIGMNIADQILSNCQKD